jgi:hypothetical protein
METPEKSGKQPEAAPPQPKDSVSSVRFLGSSADAQRAEGGARAIVMVSALAFVLVLLVWIVYSFHDPLGDRLLVTLATPRFDSPLVPPLEFVQQDLDRVRAAPGIDLSTAADGSPLPNLTTSADFTRLTDVLLPTMRHDTLILFLRLHAVGGEDNKLFLLPADADPLVPERGLEASRLLRAVADSPCRNKLVLIDIGQAPQRLRLGWFGGDLRQQLTQVYDAAIAGAPTANMVVICGRIDGRSPVSSAAVQQSLFGGLASYCLYGGAEVDGAGPGRGRRDGVLYSGEIAAYLEQSAGAWSLSGAQGASPTDAAAGTGFAVASANELLSVDRFFTGREPLDRAGEAENERRRQAAQQSTRDDSSSGGSASGGELLLVPTTDAVVNRLRTSWQRREELATSMAPYRRPRNWALYHQELRRAEALLLSGQLDEAQSVLNSDVAPLEQDLDLPSPVVVRYPWSLAYRDLADDADQTARWASIIVAAIQSPTRANLDRLRGAPFVEVEVVRKAAQALVVEPAGEDPSWTEPALLARAVETRTRAEQVARFIRRPVATKTGDAAAPAPAQPLPELLFVVRDWLAAADRLRSVAEHELYLGRTEFAGEQFDLAIAEYLAVQVKSEQLQNQIASFHRMLVEIVPYCEWLSGTSREAAWRLSVEGRLAALLRGAADFRRDPNAERLSVLAALCDDLRGSAETAVREAVSGRDIGGLYAALELPFLDSGLREDVLWALVRRSDAPRGLAGSPPSRRSGDRNSSAPPYPIRELAEALDVGLSGPVTGAAFRAMISTRLNRDPLDSSPGQTGYEQFASHLARAPFQTALLRLTRFQPTATNEIVARMTMDHLEWQMSRLSADQAASAVDASGPHAAILRNLREADPAYEESRRRSQQAFSAVVQQVSPGEVPERLRLSLSIAGLMALAEADDPHFVVDWFSSRQAWHVVALRNSAAPDARVDARESGDQWRLAVPVLELAAGRSAQVEIELSSLGGEAAVPLPPGGELTGWIALADGSRYWLPIPLAGATLPRRPLEIVVLGPGKTLLPDAIRVFPNQRLPVQMQFRGALAGTNPLRLVVSSGGVEHACDARTSTANEWNVIPGAFEVPVVGAALVVQAVSGSEIVGARTLTVEVMNPRTSLTADVTYQSDTRTITARMRRIAAASVPAAVPVQLAVSGAEVEGGILEGELQPDADEVTLQAALAPGGTAEFCYVSIGACGVPGMFQYRLDPVTGSIDRSPRTLIEIQQPQEGATHAAALEHAAMLPVAVAADADGPGQVNIGFDRDGDGYLQASERLDSRTTWSGKSVLTRFVGTADPADFAIESQVSNVVSSIPAAGLVGPQRLLAQLVAGGQFPTATRTVHFVQSPPPVEFAAPRQNDAVALGDPFEVGLTSSDPSHRAIAQVEVGVDRNNNGAWDADETLAPIDVAEQTGPPFAAANAWTRSFDSRRLLGPEDQPAAGETAPSAGTNTAPARPADEGVAAGLPRRLVLMARAVTPVRDLSDPTATVQQQSSPVARRAIRLVSPDQKPRLTGQVAGYVVTVDGVRQRDVEVVLGELATRTDDDGRFLIRGAPVGTHVVKAARGLRMGEVEVQVVGGQTTGDVEIAIKR